MAFATLDQLKRHLDIDETRAHDDDMLQGFLDKAESFVCNFCNRAFIRKEYTDMIDCPLNGRYLPLEQYPIRKITSLKIDGREMSVATVDNKFGYTFDEYGIRLHGFIFAKRQWVEVVYEAGFDVIPDILSHAVIEIAALNYRERDRIGQTSKAMNNETTSFNHDIPREIQKVLDNFKRVWSVR